jgi:hypothetical protein
MKSTLLRRLTQPFDRLSSKISFYNQLTFDEGKDYDLLERRKEILTHYQYQDLRRLANDAIGRQNTQRISVLAYGNAMENSASTYQHY